MKLQVGHPNALDLCCYHGQEWRPWFKSLLTRLTCWLRQDMSAGKPWACCPRSALRRVLAAAEEKHGLTFRLGQEVEFYLLRPGLMEDASRQGLPEPVDTSVYCQTGAFDNVAAGKPLAGIPTASNGRNVCT